MPSIDTSSIRTSTLISSSVAVSVSGFTVTPFLLALFDVPNDIGTEGQKARVWTKVIHLFNCEFSIGD